ncbi:MAG TPA: GTP-binding protein [Elusimicrobiota bacterium]|nr:GTP-binding protein [Elusimicrobiota bacterium]
MNSEPLKPNKYTVIPSNPQSAREQMSIVIVGHVDHGKSTVVGRLFADTHSLPEGKLEAVRRECRRTGKPFEYAFLLDALSDEQDQGITIDAARSFFKTAKRDYIIIDAPGHIEFLKNMISGAARAEAAALVIDAKEGVRENSRRHGYLLSMLGVKQIVMAVNKMDLVGYSEAHFRAIEKEYRAFLNSIGAASPKHFIPVSAVNGENLAHRSASMPWYQGLTLLESLDGFEKAPAKSDCPLRMPVQAVYKFVSQGDERRIVAGRVESGKVAVGDKVVFLPSAKSSTIKSIEAFNAPPRREIEAGWSTGFTLTEEIYITRGEVLCHEANPPLVSTRFRANLIWLSKKPFTADRDYKLKIHTQAVPVRIRQIVKVIDASESPADNGHRPSGQPAAGATSVQRHDIAELILETRQPIAFDTIALAEATGRFVIVDGYDIAGGGIITAAEKDNQEDLRAEAQLRDFHWISGGVSAQQRGARLGHRPALVMFVGGPNVGKHNYARAVERALFSQGKSSYMLDGTNILLGVDSDLVWVSATQQELVRRFAEVAHLFLDAGHIVVSTTNAIGLADFAAVQALIPDFPVLTVDINPSATVIGSSDLRLTGQESEDDVVARVNDLLGRYGIFKP